MYFLHENEDVNCELNYFVQAKKQFPVRGNSTKPWRYSINMSTQSKDNDMIFTEQQYEGVREIIEYYTWNIVRPKYKRSSSYEDWIYSDCWMVLSRMFDKMKLYAWKRDQNFKEEWKKDPELPEWITVTDWSNEEWTPVIVNKISERRKKLMESVDTVDTMLIYLSFVRKSLVDMWKFEKSVKQESQRLVCKSIVEWCDASLPFLCPWDMNSFEDNNDYFDFEYEENYYPDDFTSDRASNYSYDEFELETEPESHENCDYACDTCWWEYVEEEEEIPEEESEISSIDNRPNTPSLSEFSDVETQGDESCLFCDPQEFDEPENHVQVLDEEEPMEIEKSYDEVDGNAFSLVTDLLFNIPIDDKWKVYISSLYKAFMHNTSFEPVEFSWLRSDRNIYNVFKQVQQCLNGRKFDRFVRGARVLLNHYKNTDKIHFPYQYVVNTLDFNTLCEMFQAFCVGNAIALKVGLNGTYFQQFMLYSLALEIADFPQEFRIQEDLETQGDNSGEVLEKIENVEKTQNVTLVHERPVNVIHSHHQPGASTVNVHNDVSESSYSLKQMLERNIYLTKYVWGVKDTKGRKEQWMLPFSLISDSRIGTQLMRNLAFARFDMHVTVMFNGSKYCQGAAAVGISPLRTDSDIKMSEGIQDYSLPFGVLQASVSNVLEFKIPFNNVYTYLSQEAGTLRGEAGWTGIGFLWLNILNPLQVPTGCPTSLDISFYVRFENVEFHQTVHPFFTYAYSKTNIPIVAPGAPDFVTQGDEEIIVNKSVEPIVKSAKTSVLDTAGSKTISSDMSTTVEDALSFEHILKIPSLLDSFNWKQSHDPGQNLWSWVVSPTYLPEDRTQVVQGGTKIIPTILSYVSRAAVAYDGDVILKFQKIANDFFSGRMSLLFDPHWTSTNSKTYSLLKMSNVNSIVVDLQQQNEFEVRVPFSSVKPLLRCDRFRSKDSPASYLGEWHQGLVSVNVLTRLVGPPNNPGSIDFNVYIYAAENFRICMPVPFWGLQPYLGGGRYTNKLYPLATSNATIFNTDMKTYIYDLYLRGANLVRFGFLKPDEKDWFRAEAPKDMLNEDAYKWVYECKAIVQVSKGTDINAKLVKGMPNYYVGSEPDLLKILQQVLAAVKALKPNPPTEMVTQGLERYVTTGDEHPAQFSFTKTMSTHKSRVMDEAHVSLRTMLERYYPIVVTKPFLGLGSFVEVTIPVCPTPSIFMIPENADIGVTPNGLSHVEWFSMLGNYWDGSINYKIVINRTNNEVLAVHAPNHTGLFKIRPGVDEATVQQMLTYGSDIEVTHLAGALEITVPFRSTFNQLLIPKINYIPDLRYQNGCLKLYIRSLNNAQCMQQTNLTVMMSIGKDFRLNWITPPPTLFDPAISYKELGSLKTYSSPDMLAPLQNEGTNYTGPMSIGTYHPGNVIWEWTDNKDPIGAEEEMETQGLMETLQTPGKVMQKVEEAATSIPMSLEKISNTIEETSKVFSRQSQSVVEDVSSVKNNINQKLNSLNNDFGALVDKSSAAFDQVSYYVDLTATTVLSGNVIRSFIKAAQLPNQPGSWIDLGLSFAALLGFSIKHVIVKCVNGVLDWFHGNEQSRAQALSGASLNQIEENEDTILKSVAVLGTILYAYIFECIPDFTNLKNVIKNMLNREPETQGLNLRGAHFAYMGLSALSKVFDNIIFYTRKFLDWLLERDSPEAICARKAAHIQERISKCIKDIDFYDNEYEILKALVDPDAHNKMYKIVDEANELTDIFMRDKLDPRIGQILTECRTRSKALVKRLETEAPSNGWRFDPYIIVIHGDSGTGKSHIMHELMRMLAEEWDLPKYNRIYPKTVKDDFWSGYTGQPIIQWDEFGQNPENDKQAVELIELRSNLPKRLNMAALHEKGRYFNSKAMFITTNVPYIKFDTNIRDDVAYKRRRHFMLEMKHKPESDANYVQNLPRFDPEYSHCKFRRTSNMQPTQEENADWLPLSNIKEIIKQEANAWYAKQMDLYADYLEHHGLGVIPRGVVHCSAPVNMEGANTPDEARSRIASAASSLTPPGCSDLPKVTRYEERNGEPVRVTTPTASTRPLNLETENCNYTITTSAQCPAPEGTWCSIQGGPENFDIPASSNETFESSFSFKKVCDENDVFANSSTEVSLKSSSPSSSLPSLISASSSGASLGEDRTEEALLSAWDLFNIVVDHNKKPYSSVPVTQKEFVYVSGVTPSEEYEKLSEDEKRLADDYMASQQVTVATYHVPPEKVEKAWYRKLWEKVSIYFTKACKVFADIASKVVDFFKKHPKISIGFSILTALGAIAGTMWLIQQEAKPEDPDGISRWNIIEEEDDMTIGVEENDGGIPITKQLRVTRIVPEGGRHYALEQNRKGYKKVIAQGCEDPNAMNIRAVVHPNLLVIGWPVGASKKCTLRCLHLKGRLILVPFHFFVNAKEGESFVLCHRTVPLLVEYNKDRMYRVEDKDFVIYDCGAKLEPRKDVTKYFISEQDLGKVPKCNVVLCNVEYDGTLLMMSGSARAVKEYKYNGTSEGEVYSQDGWEVNLNTSNGDCGAFLLGMCKQIPGAGKILGIHTAGSKTRGLGFSVLITQEMLRKACAHFEGIVQGMPLPPEVDNSNDAMYKILPEGDYSIYGTLPNHLAPAQPQRTTFRRTPFLDVDLKDIADLRKPAYLKPFTNAAGDRISPLRIALAKYGKQVSSFPFRDIEAAKEHLADIFKNSLTSPGFGILTVEQAVLGIPCNDFAKPLNLKSASGWPYQVLEKGKPGKFHLFDEDGKIVNKALQENYDKRLEKAKQGIRVPSLWRDCLKDELRPNEKVDAGKTRLFTIAPVDFNILVRQYFMDFNVAFYSANCTFFSAVGVDPESMDWTRMYQYLAECGTKTIAGDYSCFDGTLLPDVMDACVDAINEWYDDGPENAMVRKTLMNEMIHTLQLVETTVYATHKGDPSGNPETAILNTCCGWLYLALAFKRIYPDKSLSVFRKYCRCIIYGDDLLATVKEEIEEFNQENLTKVFAERGITFTNETKDDRDVGKFRELKEVQFLKRGFRKDPDFGTQFWLATMSEETLQSYFHWVRENPDLEDQLQQNMAACLRFAAFHGKEKYNWYLQKWQTCMKNVGYKSITTTFAEQVDSFHGTVGMICRDAKFHQMLKDLTTEGDEEKVLATIEEKIEQPSRLRVFAETMWEVTKFAAGYWITKKIIDWTLFSLVEVEMRNQNALWSRTDSRCAVCIPSGEGKTTLAQEHPRLFIDHDEYILKTNAFEVKASCMDHIRKTVEEEFGKPIEELSWFEKAKLKQAFARIYEKWVRQHDAPPDDRRILLTHHPRNTKRQIIGCYVLPEPTHIRQNLAGRKALLELKCDIMPLEERNALLIRLADEKEGLRD